MNYFVKMRLIAIEACLRWKGELGRVDLENLFGITNQQASLDFRLYRKKYPNQMVYDLNIKRYLPTKTFEPILTGNSSVNYFAFLITEQSADNPMSIGSKMPVELVEPQERAIPDETIRLIHRAINRSLQLKIDYQSLNSTKKKTTIISPHSMVFNGFRWHVRAYSESHKMYRDFLPIRISDAKLLSVKSTQTMEKDTAWNTYVDLEFAPHPSLSKEQQKILLKDYKATAETWFESVRKPMVHYRLEFLAIKKETGEQDRQDGRKTIILKNIDDVRSYYLK